jgi:DNA (cytosine-5)-methyltransferase 1
MQQVSESVGIECAIKMDGNRRRPTVIDLFAGVGGLSLGAMRAGFKLALAVENDPHASKAHQTNFPKVKHSEADVSTLGGAALLKAAGLEAGDLDGLIGGPPCQGFSTIGTRNVGDPRNSLFRKFHELVAQTRPKFFVAENVLGILDAQYDEIRKQAFALVSDDYVLIPPMRFKASDYGAPTSRERVFFVGYRGDALRPLTPANFEAQKVKTPTLVREALAGLPSIRSDWQEESQGWRWVQPLSKTRYGQRIVGCIPGGIGDCEALRRYREQGEVSGCLGTVHTDAVRERFASVKPGETDAISRAPRLDPDGLCPTLRAGTASDRGSYQAVRPIHPTMPRVNTPREAARLQGFPDWFRFAPSKWHSFRQIGNSVSPFVAEAVLSLIKKTLL